MPDTWPEMQPVLISSENRGYEIQIDDVKEPDGIAPTWRPSSQLIDIFGGTIVMMNIFNLITSAVDYALNTKYDSSVFIIFMQSINLVQYTLSGIVFSSWRISQHPLDWSIQFTMFINILICIGISIPVDFLNSSPMHIIQNIFCWVGVVIRLWCLWVQPRSKN